MGVPDSRPIEPEEGGKGKPHFFKWLLFIFIIIYFTLSYFHAPILTYLGGYLIVEHPPKRSDLIVCLGGGNIERGLATAEAFEKGLGRWIFLSREALPDGYKYLQGKGVSYPQSIDLLISLLGDLGVPPSAFIVPDKPVKSTFDEANAVKRLSKERGYRSLILITSPTHSRRAWLTYREVFGGGGVRIIMRPSHYSDFHPEDWWKKRRYIRQVIIEYRKLIFYFFKDFL